jgi:hypothetical protein
MECKGRPLYARERTYTAAKSVSACRKSDDPEMQTLREVLVNHPNLKDPTETKSDTHFWGKPGPESSGLKL